LFRVHIFFRLQRRGQFNSSVTTNPPANPTARPLHYLNINPDRHLKSSATTHTHKSSPNGYKPENPTVTNKPPPSLHTVAAGVLVRHEERESPIRQRSHDSRQTRGPGRTMPRLQPRSCRCIHPAPAPVLRKSDLSCQLPHSCECYPRSI
jgi:hypothetical protein